MTRLTGEFFTRDVLEVAPDLIGKVLVRVMPDGTARRGLITEVEAYRGQEDKACHAARGKTPRTRIMYERGGHVYMYLIYGMYWMLNFVCAEKEDPQAVLIRGLDSVSGPGRLTRALQLDRSFYGIDLAVSDALWVEDHGNRLPCITTPRIGLEPVEAFWRDKPWRFLYQDGQMNVH